MHGDMVRRGQKIRNFCGYHLWKPLKPLKHYWGNIPTPSQVLAWYTLEKLRQFKLAASPSSSKSGSGQSNEDTGGSNEEYNAASIAGSAASASRRGGIAASSPQPPPPDLLSSNLNARDGLSTLTIRAKLF